MLEVPDYSKIFDKYYDVLKDKIIRYAKKYETLKERRARGELDHPESCVINLDNVSHNIAPFIIRGKILPDKYSAAEDFFCSELSDILPKMYSERIALENDEVGDDEDEAWDSGFWGDCDEAWDSYMNQIIYDIVEEDE